MRQITYLKNAYKTLADYDKDTRERLVESIDRILQGDILKIVPFFCFILGVILIFLVGCNSAPKNASNDLVITQNDEKAVLEYLDIKTDDIAYSSEGKMYSAFKILGTDSNKIYLWIFKQEYIKKKGQTALEKGQAVLAPVVLTIEKNDKEFSIISHKFPRDGVDYGKDVGKLFPRNIEIPYNDREVILKLEKSSKNRAEREFDN